MKNIRWMLFPIFLLSSDQALADDDQEGDRKVVYRQKTEIDFEGLDVEATLVKPQGALVLERKQAAFNPLIKMRTDWNAEIDQSTQEIR